MRNFTPRRSDYPTISVVILSPGFTHVPVRQVDDFPGRKAELPKPILEKVVEVETLLTKWEMNSACEIIEKSFLSGALAFDGIYEYEFLIAPLDVYSNQSEDDPSAGERAAAHLLEWYQGNPDNPYAAATAATAMHDVGYSWRGTDWAHEVTQEGWERLNGATESAVLLLDESRSKHGDHWYWRETDLHLAISDYRGPEDHSERFELALACQPDSTRVWSMFAHQLLPRWYGSFEQIHALAARGFNENQAGNGAEIFHEIFKTVYRVEESMGVMFREPVIQRKIAEQKSASSLDVDLAVAASMFYDIGEHQKALECLKRIDILYLDHWYCDYSPEWMAAKTLH